MSGNSTPQEVSNLDDALSAAASGAHRHRAIPPDVPGLGLKQNDEPALRGVLSTLRDTDVALDQADIALRSMISRRKAKAQNIKDFVGLFKSAIAYEVGNEFGPLYQEGGFRNLS